MTAYQCPNGAVAGARLLAGPLDWNCDGVILGQLALDLNGDGALTAFAPFLDRPALNYRGGGIGDLGTSPLPGITAMIEPDLDELIENKNAIQEAVKKAQQQPPGHGDPVVSYSKRNSWTTCANTR
ncbi:MAG: hypothetical protein WDZ37_04295 [Solirubrobacterales bacterium]